ncbi:MAG: peptidase T [Candidatus Heimdallarchaeota archaeon]
MSISEEIRDFLLNDVLERFLRYVKVCTTSDITSTSFPSTVNQFELGKILLDELKQLGLKEVIQDKNGFVYANFPPSKDREMAPNIGLLAHLDTSSAVSGKNVKPVIHRNYKGGEITLSKNLSITMNDSTNLANYIGLDIVTSEGDTLLGADDKAGIAEIMAACAAWKKFPELKHGPISICFSPDEETGKQAILRADEKRIPKICYTIDGGEIGELEYECFDAWLAIIDFKGLSVHTGYAKDKMINAIHIACRFLSELPESESPEHTEEREGFFHIAQITGSAEESSARIMLRDFELEGSERRINFLKILKNLYEIRYPGLIIELNFTHQYENMLRYVEKEQRVIDLAKKAIQLAGLDVKVHSIRGGTDGSSLSAKGIPTPNIFTGGELFHSRKEYIPTLSLQKATETIIHLAELWSKEK